MQLLTRWSIVRIASLALLGGAIGIVACSQDDGSPTGPGLTTTGRRANILYNYVYPTSDVLEGASWTPGSGKWDYLNEVTPDEGPVYRVHFGTSVVIDSFQVRFGTFGYTPDPLAGNCYLLLRWRFTGNYDPNTPQPTMLRYALNSSGYNGTTLRSTWGTDSIGFSPSGLNWNVGQTVKVWIQEKSLTASGEVQAQVTWAAIKCPTAN
jgi:hypothetical protein